MRLVRAERSVFKLVRLHRSVRLVKLGQFSSVRLHRSERSIDTPGFNNSGILLQCI